MNSRKKTSFCFQRFYVRFISNKHHYFMSDRIQSWLKFAYIRKVLCSVPDQISTAMFIQYSLDGSIFSESFPFFPKIFFVKDWIEENRCFVVAVNFKWEINSLNTPALHTHCTFRHVRNRFQPQTRLWNYEQAMLIKIDAAFRNLLMCSFDATIRVKRAFIYFKTWTLNDHQVSHG